LKAAGSRFLTSLAGLSPEAIALVVAVGFVLGVFPVFGLPTVLCALAAVILRLNLPAIQLINQVSSPVQLALLIPLSRVGSLILGDRGSPNLAAATRNAILGWVCICVPLGMILYVLLLFVLRRRRRQWFNGLESSA
jgi:uncharacterized protein (DUF2062 family)